MKRRLLLKSDFLTPQMAEKAVTSTLTMLDATEIGPMLSRKMCHVTILAPGKLRSRWPSSTIQPYTLYEFSWRREEWGKRKFDKIARNKAQQLWTGQNANGNMGIKPHLLFRGDTKFWGGVVIDGIVVACSGLQPYFDQAVAGTVAHLLIALSRHAWSEKEPAIEGFDFLP